MKKSKIIRRFERFMFHGVPERPEPTFQRNDHANYTDRQTGKSSGDIHSWGVDNKSIIIGYIKDDFENQTETFISADAARANNI